DGGISAARFANDGSVLAVGGSDNAVTVMRVPSGEVITAFTLADTVVDLAFSPAGSHLAFSSKDGTTRVLDVARRVELARLEHGGSSLGFGLGGRSLLTVGADRRAYVYSAVATREVSRIAFSRLVYAIRFSNRGSLLAIGSDDGVHVFDTLSGHLVTGIG